MTGRFVTALLIATLLIGASSGCTGSKGRGASGSVSGPGTFEAGQLTLAGARSKVGKGQLAAALVDYKALALLSPNNPTVRKERAELERRIQSTVSRHMQRGRQAARRNRAKDARQHYLIALAADPRHRGAFEALRKLETADARRIQQRAGLDAARSMRSGGKMTYPTYPTTEDPEPAIAPAPEATLPSAEETAMEAAQEHLQSDQSAAVHVKHARQLAANGSLTEAENALAHLQGLPAPETMALHQDIASIRTSLADAYYERGLAVFADDLDAAITAWRKSINLNPSDEKVASTLSRAERLRAARADASAEPAR